MNKGLLIETHLFEAKLQQEENGTYLVKGILQRAGAPNQNNRRYPKEILERVDDDDDVMITCFVSYNLGMQYEEDAIMDMMVVTWT